MGCLLGVSLLSMMLGYSHLKMSKPKEAATPPATEMPTEQPAKHGTTPKEAQEYRKMRIFLSNYLASKKDTSNY